MEYPTEKLIAAVNRARGDNEINSLLEKVTSMLKSKPSNIDLLQARASLFKKLQEFGKAINDYQTILSVDKDNRQAQIQIEQLLTILRYQNTDIFESPNTNFDPWLD